MFSFYKCVVSVSVFLISLISAQRHNSNREHPVCVMTSRHIHQTLQDPCMARSVGIFHHRMEPSNICFLKEGRIITSLQAMLETISETFDFNQFDMELLNSISMNLPTRLENFNMLEYTNTLRRYYREFSCLTMTMDRVQESTHGRPRQQNLCHLVHRHIRPMLCVDQEDIDPAEQYTAPRHCTDWASLDSGVLDIYAYWTIKRFEGFLSNLSPICRVTLRV